MLEKHTVSCYSGQRLNYRHHEYPLQTKCEPRSKQTVMCYGIADSLIGIQLPLVVVQPSRWFANRCVCAVPSSVRMTTNNGQIYSWVGSTSRENGSLHRLISLSVTAATIEANKIIKEWEIYGIYLACIRLDVKNIMFCCSCHGLDTIGIRRWCLLTVEWRLYCVELTCNAVLDVCRIG